MDLKLFDDRIITPSKCGTRHLRKVFTDKRFNPMVDDIQKVTNIIVRNPIEHFESAIHTEYLNYINSYGDNEDVYHIINGLTSKDGIGHWHPNTYEFLYTLFLKNTSIKVIDLKNLTEFLTTQGHTIEYNPNDYNWSKFDVWFEKKEIIEKLTSKFKNELEFTHQILDKEMIFYNKLITHTITKNII